MNIEPQQTKSTTTTQPNIRVHFIDVGQADSILIEDGTNAMLIDAGNNADSNLVVNYIRSKGIKKLSYVIGTHPHEDHIGDLDVAIKSFDVSKVICQRSPIQPRRMEMCSWLSRAKG